MSIKLAIYYIKESINPISESILLLQKQAQIEIENYYREVSEIRSKLEKGAEIGSIGPLMRKKNSAIYIYWVKFNSFTKNNNEKYMHYSKQYKKGGANVFKYSFSVFEKDATDWEMILIKKFDSQFSVIRELLRSQQDLMKKQKKLLSKKSINHYV